MTLRCAQCDGEKLEVCLPAWFDANGTFESPTSVDDEAEALSYYCPQCQDSVPAADDNGHHHYGRWQTNQELG